MMMKASYSGFNKVVFLCLFHKHVFMTENNWARTTPMMLKISQRRKDSIKKKSFRFVRHFSVTFTFTHFVMYSSHLCTSCICIMMMGNIFCSTSV